MIVGSNYAREGVQWHDVDGQLVPFYRSDDGSLERRVWEPLPGSQCIFLDCAVPEVLYEGNRGPGKTDALLMDFAQDVGKGWGADWTGILFRKTYPELQDVIGKSRRWFALAYPEARFNSQQSTWEWPTGERLKFRHFAKAADYWRYHGHAYPWIGWEELCSYADDACYKSMFSCLRSTRVGMPRKVRATCNPYGPGHNWVKARWQLPVPPGRIVGPIIRPGSADAGGGLERVAIHGHLDENLILLRAQPGYKDAIRAAARNAAELDAWLNGSWDIVAGGMIDDIWARLKHRIVVEPFPIPPNWRLDRSLDWGSSKPSSVGFWAESDGSDYRDAHGRWRSTIKGDLFRVGEIYTWNGQPNEGTRILATDLARRIVEFQIEREWQTEDECLVHPGPADSSIFDEENGNCIAEDLARPATIGTTEYEGARFERADKKPGSRQQGWEQLRKYLSHVEPRPGAGREEPGLFIWSNCSHWLRTVPTLPRDEKNMDDVDTAAEDHCGDETRYRLRLQRNTVTSGRVVGAY